MTSGEGALTPETSAVLGVAGKATTHLSCGTMVPYIVVLGVAVLPH